MLGIGGLVYMDSRFVNMMPAFFAGEVLDSVGNQYVEKAHSAMTISTDPVTGYCVYEIVPESERKIESYGAMGNAFSALSQKAQKVIAMPQL